MTGQPPKQLPAELLPLLQAARQADDLYKASGCATALNQLIEIWRALTSSPSFASAPDDFRSASLNALAFAIHRRFLATGRQEDLDAAIEHGAQAIQLTADKASHLTGRLNNQGAALMARYGISQQLEDLDAAIETLWRIEWVTDHVDRPVFLTNLVSALRTRYDRTQEAVDLDAVIDACSLADATPPDKPPPAEILQCLADSLYIRFQLSNRPADLDRAIDTTRQALSTISDAQPPLSLPHFLINLADALYTRFEQRRDVADLDGCIESFRDALARIGDSEPLKYSSLGFLGKALRQRYSARGEVADLDEAIASLSRATELGGSRLNDQPRYRTELADDLASSLTARSEATSSIDDLERAIDVYGSVDTDAPGAAERVSLLGAALARLYERNGDLDCLTRAIEAQERAVATLPAGAPGLPGALSNLAAVLGLRYERLGKEFDVSKAIEICERGPIRRYRTTITTLLF